jgi:hypothetical protein
MAFGKEAKLRALEAQEQQRRLTREEVLKPRIRQEEVPIAGLGGTVLLRGITHGLRNDLRKQAKYGTPEYDDDLFTRLYIVHSIVDPPMTLEDVETLKEQDSVVFDELVLQINVFGLAGAAETLKKDSKLTQNNGSLSDLPSA